VPRRRHDVEKAQGRIADAIELSMSRANPIRYGVAEPAQIMRKLGADLTCRF
jgi:hypothetical protein